MNQANKHYVNDIHSKLNRTKVCEIVKPESAENIQCAVKKAKSAGKSISVAGGFHAMGGQQFFDRRDSTRYVGNESRLEVRA